MASLPFDQVTAQSSPPAIDPEAIYHGPFSSDEIRLRIATGGAGQSGLLKALADAFIDEHVRATGCAPFAVSWLKSDTAFSFNSLAQGAADLSITYHPAAEQIALDQGFVARKVYAWRDHFMLVGQSQEQKTFPPPSLLPSFSLTRAIWKKKKALNLIQLPSPPLPPQASPTSSPSSSVPPSTTTRAYAS